MRLTTLLLAVQSLNEKCASFQPILPLHQNRGIGQKSGTIASGSAIYMARDANPKVIYQKVLRPNHDNPAFLPSLIDYIQNQFEVPNDLPMVYTSTIPGEESESDEKVDRYSLLELNSPLSRTPDLTGMNVEVVGIYTAKDDDGGIKLPSMAMVVVKKMNVDDTRDVMLKRMFDDSESKIVKALENGLNDFVEGKIQVEETNVDNDDAGEWSGLEALDDYEGFDKKDGIIEDLMVASTGRKISNLDKGETISNDGGIVDAVIAEPSPEKELSSPAIHEEQQMAKETEVEDFAVRAAKLAAAAKQKESKDTSVGDDYAVELAKAAAKLHKLNKSENVESEEDFPTIHVDDDEDEADIAPTISTPPVTPSSLNEIQQGVPMELPTTGVSPMLKNLSKRGKSSFQVKISSPETFTKRDNAFERAIAKTKKEQDEKNEKKKQLKVNMVVDSSIDTESLTEEERQKNLDNIRFQESPVQEERSTGANIENGKITKTDKEIEQDILKAAMNIMPGTANEDATDGMSAEELLKDILKFGEEKEKEDADGSGFVKGAFSKAKELSDYPQNGGGNEQQKKSKNTSKDLKFKEMRTSKDGKLSAEEELKKIFAAGESIAEGRIARSMGTQQNSITSPNSESVVTEQYVDELIEADKTVPGNALSLDEELAQLELRINKSPGEDTEAYGTNALFDVFSGPEVYNPNVDPTSVNFPGAQLGTRTDVRLPSQLSEAVKSAKFAASLLSKMIEEEQDDETKTFYIDGKEISTEQVQRLQRAVDEGVTIGLIGDPIQYLKERSRLQMLVNELVTQPKERFDEISSFYKDLLLSDNFVTLLKENLREMATRHLEMQRSGEDPTKLEEKHAMERNVLGQLVKYSQLLLKETQALGAELEATQVEVIRSICKVAMDPSHKSEEETSEALTDAVRDMKPLLDETFVAYLKFAIAEEQARLARAGLLDDPEHNRWLFVLQIVQEGVYAELAVGVQRYIDHIGYVLRMDTKIERKQLLSKFIDVMPSMVRTIGSVVIELLNFQNLTYFNIKGCQTVYQNC